MVDPKINIYITHEYVGLCLYRYMTISICRSSQCSTSVTKAMVCTFLLLDGAYKRSLAANRKE